MKYHYTVDFRVYFEFIKFYIGIRLSTNLFCIKHLSLFAYSPYIVLQIDIRGGNKINKLMFLDKEWNMHTSSTTGMGYNTRDDTHYL